MDTMWMGISPGAHSTRVLAMRGPGEKILKAHLRLSPSSPRALPALLEALGLWEGLRVRAALVVDDDCAHGSTSLYRDSFGVHDCESALYSLDWVPRAQHRRCRDALQGMGKFHDLEKLVIRGLAR